MVSLISYAVPPSCSSSFCLQENCIGLLSIANACPETNRAAIGLYSLLFCTPNFSLAAVIAGKLVQMNYISELSFRSFVSLPL
nr:hypothetical protein CFP56_73440 [Quercus suber]